jgi:hypothetical protein
MHTDNRILTQKHLISFSHEVMNMKFISTDRLPVHQVVFTFK